MKSSFPANLAAPVSGESFDAVLQRRLARRCVLGAAGAAAAWYAMPTLSVAAAEASPGGVRGDDLRRLARVAAQRSDALRLAEGYHYNIVARFGDSLYPGTSDLADADLRRGSLVTAEAADLQRRRFGANNDAVAFFALGGQRDRNGLLCVNHEYTTAELVFTGIPASPKERVAGRKAWIEAHPHAVAWMQAAHGVSVMHVARGLRGWTLQRGGRYTRRITANTPCAIHGPARGHELMRTRADPHGVQVLGTFANCAGGKTPWGTYLTAEENFDDYFGGARSWSTATADACARAAHVRFPLEEHSSYGWDYADARFDLRQEPHEAFRFGWIVEIDPRDPTAAPRKRTALGRFSHEGANTLLARDGRVAAYMGDDEKFEYLYKFVTRDRFDPQHPEANKDLLDHGTLMVARFDADGRGEWLPLVHDESGPLNSRAGFRDQGDVVLETRRAADLLGATPMDRPEDVEPSPVTGRVYVSCTMNRDRSAAGGHEALNGRDADLAPNAANPRPHNEFGHILEIIEHDDDAAAMSFRWEVVLLAGDPHAADGRVLARYEDLAPGRVGPHDTWYAGFTDASLLSPLACPDNLGIDPQGRLWIVSDTDDHALANNGCFVVPTQGCARGMLRQIASAPIGAEICGCEFTPDGTTLFLSIQHPGEGGSIDAPISHWPDGGDAPARSALVAVRRDDGMPL